MTKNLKIFAVFGLVWSIPFFATLNWCLQNSDKRWPFIWLSMFVYGAGFSIAGSYLGERDSNRDSRRNRLTNYFIVSITASNIVGVGWNLVFKPHRWSSEAIAIGISLVALAVIASINQRRTIKGIPKKELFR